MTTINNIMDEIIGQTVNLKNERKIERKFTLLPYLVFTLLLMFGLGIRLWHIGHSALPFSFDPYYHMATSASIIETKQVSNKLAYDAGKAGTAYPPLLSITGAIASESGFNIISFYRYGTIVITTLIALLLLIFLRNFFPPWPSVLGAISYISLPYVFSRTILTLPENLSVMFVLLVLVLLALYNRQKSTRGRALAAIGILLAITLDYYTHYTYLLSILFVVVYMLLKSIERRKWISLIIMLATCAVAGYFIWKRISGTIHFEWPAMWSINKNFGEIGFWVGDLGLIAAFIIGLRKQPEKLVLLFTVVIPLIAGWVLFRGSGQGLGSLEPERWLIFASIAIAIGISATFYIVLSIKWQSVSIVLTLILAITILWPRWSNAWPAIYNPAEYEAAIYIKDNISQDALYFSQPVLEWLLRGVSNRYVIVGHNKPFDSLGATSFSNLSIAVKKYGYSQGYVVFSDNPNNPDNITLMSDGSEKKLDLSGELETPNIDKSRFECLEQVWTNETVTIYKVPTADELPKVEKCEKKTYNSKLKAQK